MRRGYSYVFEAIYADNVVIVTYPHEACVLLTVRDARGAELDREGVVAAARALNVPVVRLVRGRACDFRESAASVADIGAEGWVLQAPRVGGVVREKVVRTSWKRAWVGVNRFVNPIAVIDALGDEERHSDAMKELCRTFGHTSVHIKELYAIHAALAAMFLKYERLFAAHVKNEPNASVDVAINPWLEAMFGALEKHVDASASIDETAQSTSTPRHVS